MTTKPRRSVPRLCFPVSVSPPAAEQAGEGYVLRVVRLGPAELDGERPGLLADLGGSVGLHGQASTARRAVSACLVLIFFSPQRLAYDGASLRPHQGRCVQVAVGEEVEPVGALAGADHYVRVNDQHAQCPWSRWARISVVQSGCGVPSSNVLQLSGIQGVSGSSSEGSLVALFSPRETMNSSTGCVRSQAARQAPPRSAHVLPCVAF